MNSLRPFLHRVARRATGLALAALAALSLQVSCSGGGGGSNGGGGGKTLSSVSISPAAPVMAKGTLLQLTATAHYSDGSSKDITATAAWTSSATSVATVTSGVAAGLVAGTTTITAASGSHKATATLTVTNATLASLTIAPVNPVVAKGATQAFTATGHFSDATTQDLTAQALWTSSSTAIATIASTGVATGAGAGAATISAAFGAVTGSTGILVTPGAGVSLTGIALSPLSPKIAAGTSLQFKAIGTFSDASTADVSKAVSWSSGTGSVATISASGLASGLAPGASLIGAANGSVSGSTTLTVSSATLSSISITPVDPVIPVAGSQAFTATGHFSDASTQDLSSQVTWTSATGAVATINAGGTATGIAAGTTTITAAKGAVSGSTLLTVAGTSGVTLTSIAVTPANAKIAASTSLQYKAVGTFSDASTRDLTAVVAWSSSATAVATINATGLASGLAPGSATISAAAGAISGSTGLTVSNATLTSIAVTPVNPVIPVGSTQAFTATGAFSDGSSQDLTTQVLWASSATGTATINGATGLATAVAAGSTTIAAAKGAVVGSTGLTVTAKAGVTLTSLTLAPSAPTIAKGTSVQFTATGHFSDGSTSDLSAAVAWTSSATAIATVNATGLASGLTAGSSTIKATAGAVNASATLTVTNATLSSIAVTPANPKIAAGTGLQFKAVGTFSDLSTQDLTTQVTWASSSAAASINSSGFALGASAGTATISATSGAISGSTTLTVTNATLVSIAVTPANSSVAKGSTRQFTATGKFSDLTTQDLSGQVAWSSTNPGVATISGAGLATGVATGTTTIKATFNAVSGATFLTVVPAAPVTLVSIAVTPSPASIAKGTTQAFTAMGTYSDSSTLDLSKTATWSSSDNTVATLGATGLATGAGVGTATVKAAVGAVNGTASLTVTSATLKSIALTPLTPSIAAGTGQQFTATGTFSDGSKQNISGSVAWASTTLAAATIDAAGFATGVAPGSTTISATSGALSASTTLTVTNATLVSIAVTPANAKLAAGFTRQFTATGTFSDASTQNLTGQATWSSSITAAATIDAAGLATGVAPGATTIGASFGAISGSTTLTVTNATLIAIAVTPANSALAQGSTRQFTATGTFSDASTLDLTGQSTWASSLPAVASISSSGLATGLAQGTTAISATSAGVTGSTNLTVTTTAATLVSIVVAPSSGAIAKGQSLPFTATGLYSNGTTANLTSACAWTTSDGTVATVSLGLAKGVGVGSATITASSGAISGSATLTVNPAIPTALALTPVNPSLAAGFTQQFTATATYSDGSKVDVSASATWGSTNVAAATISGTGLTTGVAAGTSTISAAFGSFSASTTLTVTSATLASIAVTPSNPKLAKGFTLQFTATGTFSDGSTQNLSSQVTWASSNTPVASISLTGQASGLAAGTSTITATSGAISGSTTLTVTNATLVSLAVSPINATVAVGATKAYTAIGTFSDTSKQNLTTQVAWTSSDPLTASIASTGVATGFKTGAVTIQASRSAITASTTLTVIPAGATLRSIAVSPASATIAKGQTKAFSATAVFSDGSTVPYTNAVTWASTAPSVATVNVSGVATGAGVGTASITATSGAVVGSASLTVNPAALVSIALSPLNPSAAAGTTVQFTATGSYTDGTKADLSATASWASTSTGAATINGTGLASALAAGTTTISATSGAVSASTTLTVTSATLVSIAVTPATAKIAAGTGVQFKATGTFSDASTQNLSAQVIWNSTNTAAATISASGFASGLSAGSSTITAQLGTVTSNSATLTVTNATLVSIAVTPINGSVVKGATKQYAAVGTFNDGTKQNLTTQVAWASSAPSIASISTTGLATGLGVGTTTISATFGAITGGTYLTVLPSGVTLSAINLTPADPAIPKGTTKAFTATGVYSDGSSQNLSFASTWASSDTSVASVTNLGVAKGLLVGATTITATFGTITGATSLTITPAVLTSLAISPLNASIAAGTSRQFKATGTFSDGTKLDVTSAVTWNSTVPAAATIDAAGLASGVAAGSTTISAASGAINASTTLTVTSATLVSIAVTPANPAIAANTGQQFKATGTFSDASTQDLTTQVTWNSTVPSVATVDGAGFASGLAAGTTAISATFNTISGSTNLTVTNATLVSIAVTPVNGTVQQNGTKQFKAVGTFSDSSTQDLTAQAVWSSSDATVASIDTTGLATGLLTGTTTITATFNAVAGSTFLTVVPPSGMSLVSISVTPPNPSVVAGASVQFTATGTYSNGTTTSTADLTYAATWSSTTTSVATIGATGLAATAAAGTSTIKAALGGVSGSTLLTVSGVSLTSIVVTPANATIAKSTSQQFTATGHYNDGSSADITATVTWASTNTGAATIATGGLATGVGGGSTTISATFGAVSGSTTLTVTTATLTSIAVTPINAVIPAGSSQQFTATGTFSDLSTQDLSAQVGWASSANAVATIDGAGLASGLSKGTTTITATFGGVSGSTYLNVSATSAALKAVVVTPPAPSIAAGTTQQFTATGVFTDNTTQDLTAGSAWSSSTPLVATIDGAGLATAVAAGGSTISATANGLTGNASLTVTSATLVSIQVTPAGSKIAAGTTLQYTATGHFSDGSIQDISGLVTWGSSATGAATIDSTGLATGVAAGGTTISATLGLVSGSTSLTVTSATLASISISPVDPSIAKGTTEPFMAEGLFSDGSKQDLSAQVTWSSSDTSVATIDASGLATGAGTGTTTIGAAFGAVSSSTTLTVTPATLVSITVTPVNPSAPAGVGVQFTATGTFTDGSSQDLTSLAGWTSTDTATATVDPAGLATGLKPGSVSIAATIGSVSGSTALTISTATLVSISVDPPTPFLPLGSQQQMTATGLYSDGTFLDLTSQAVWASSTTTVAQIDPSGLVTTPSGSVTGTTTVSATFGGVSGSTLVTVTPATLVSISVFGDTPLGVGTTDPYTATGIYSDGSTADLTAQATWSSSDVTVATVDNTPLVSGTVTAIGAGTATITATFGSVSGSASVTVTAASLTSITVTPTAQTIARNTTLQYTATGNYSDGSTQDLTLLAAWSSSNPAAATISSASGTEGLATGLAAGTTTISASFGGVVGSTGLTVTAANLVSIAVTPANSTLPRGFTQQMVATGTFDDGSTQDISAQVTWSSSNATVASISNLSGSQGVVTALVAGTTTLTATLNGVSGSTGLTVSNVVLVSIAVTPANKTISVGKRQKMTATGTFSDGSTKNISNQVTWLSSDPTVARINTSKKGGIGKVLALSPGTVTITATKPPSGGQPAVSGSTSLTVR